MLFQDRVYGEIKIDEPVILDLIESPSFVRLKDIDQAGYFEPYCPNSRHTRFEHSLGVYNLLKIYNAPLEEQIAGLIHDVSHSAFSHASDYIFDEGSQKEQNHQDNVFEEYVRNSEIPGIIKKYSLDIDRILDDANFPLKEKDLPALCADRIDYSLRGMMAYKTKDKEAVSKYLENLESANQDWVFKNYDAAFDFAEAFRELNEKYYSSLETAVMYRTIGDCLKYALSQEYISKEDLYTTDKLVLEKVEEKAKDDEKLNFLFERMKSGKGFENNRDNYDVIVYTKSRIVDPLCFYEGKIERVSDIHPEWAMVVREEMKPKEYFIKFLDNK